MLYVTRASICVELRPFYWSKRILLPMSYITFLGIWRGPNADDVDLEVDLKSTSGRPQVNLWYLPTHLTHLPQVDLKSTSGRLGSLPRRHRSQCLHMTNGTWPNKGSKPSIHKPQNNEHLISDTQPQIIVFFFLKN